MVIACHANDSAQNPAYRLLGDFFLLPVRAVVVSHIRADKNHLAAFAAASLPASKA
jgi:hypothetical protein